MQPLQTVLAGTVGVFQNGRTVLEVPVINDMLDAGTSCCEELKKYRFGEGNFIGSGGFDGLHGRKFVWSAPTHTQCREADRNNSPL